MTNFEKIKAMTIEEMAEYNLIYDDISDEYGDSANSYRTSDDCYFTDDKEAFEHDTEKLSVPAFKGIKGGTFYEFCNREINSIINLSSERMQIE